MEGLTGLGWGGRIEGWGGGESIYVCVKMRYDAYDC